jgi:hypothetical protein
VTQRDTTTRKKPKDSLARQAGRFVLKAALAAVVVAVVAVVGIAGVTWAYGEYGFHPEENAASWAALAPSYANSAACRSCHAEHYGQWQASKHAEITCESCHGPLAAHAADPKTAPTVVNPTTEQCVTCHQEATGRPVGFPQVSLTEHYPGVTCLQCHNPHTTIAQAPVKVTHSLANLPTCVTCHGSTALHPFPAGHQESTDTVCLGCHKPAQPGQ